MYYEINNNGRNFISSSYRRNTVLMNKYNTQQVNDSSTSLLNKTASPKKIGAKFNYPGCEELSFKGNIIDIKQGHNYSVKTLLHGSTQVSVERNRSRLLFNKLNPTAEVSDYFTEAQYTDMAKTNSLIKFLSKEGTVAERLDLIRTFLPDYKDSSASLLSIKFSTKSICIYFTIVIFGIKSKIKNFFDIFKYFELRYVLQSF